MSARLAEIERRMRLCLEEIERLRAARVKLYGDSYAEVENEGRRYTSPDECERLAKLTLVEREIKTLEAEFVALRIQKAGAELDEYLGREIERAKLEPNLSLMASIARLAQREVEERLDEAEREARRELKGIWLRYMTDHDRRDHERRQREQARERRMEQELGHER